MLSNGEKIGHYKVQSAIGAGGMGEIYRANDLRLRRDVAIKILPEKLMCDALAIERFMREAHTVSALNHPNILTIFDIGEQDNIRFIATEFIRGKTLRERLQEKPLKLVEILAIAVQVAEALAAAHGCGIIHRDIKPENIMIRHDGYIKVLDFGIAKLANDSGLGNSDFGIQNQEIENPADLQQHNPQSEIQNPESTNPGVILGTVSYMSPEQARGREVDERSDIFSLGVCLYEMIAGRAPFSGETASDVMTSILKSEPPPLSGIVKNLPPGLERVIAKALKKDLGRRYQSAAEILGELKSIRQRLDFESEVQRFSSEEEIARVSAEFTENATRILTRPPARTRRAKTRKAIDSLAVLPFVNARGDENTEYLSDGITECVINSLSKLPKLRVVPRSTVFRYKGRETDVQEIGQELGVRAIFSGRIQQHGDSVVVKAELVDIANEAQIWGDQYRRKMKDIFNLLEEIAEDISEELKLKLTGEQKKRLAKRYTENTKAYQLYLKGRYFVTTKRTEEWIKKGIEHFGQAIDLDPNYALAYSGMAEAYGFLASSTGGWCPHEAYPKSKAAALKALELDPELAEAHCSLGFSLLLYDWDFAGAEREFLQAIKLNPKYPNAHDGYGFYLKAVGRHQEAIEKGKLVRQLDPLSTFAHVSLGYAYYFARDYEMAIEECQKALEMDKNLTFAYRNIGLAYLQLKKFDQAFEALNKAITYSCGGLAFESYLGVAYAIAGKHEEARRVLENLEVIDREKYVPAYNFAMIYAGLGEADRAFEWFEKAVQERSGFLPFLAVEPIADCLRDDPRYRELLGRIRVSR
jgi:serine/threonine protein kinase/Tfp pilus assembly protein PilF